MRIPKAILLTLFFAVIWYAPQLGLIGLHKYTDILGEKVTQHLYGIVVLGMVISYLTIFHFFWKPRPDLKAVFDIKRLDLNIIPYLLLIVIGLGFTWQPLFDFDKILDYYRYSEIAPHSNRFAGFNPTYLYINVSSILIAPVFEELFFREFLFNKLLKNNKVWTSILTSSLCFSAIHFETPLNLIPTFIYGTIACLIYLKTKNLVYLVIMHFFNNLCVMLCAIFGESFFDWLYSLNYDFMYWSLFIFGILATALGIKNITTANIDAKK